jgi:hypothetical protein
MARCVRHTQCVVGEDANPRQVFIWKVPEGFSLYSDAEEPADIAPVAKLSGHMRFACRAQCTESALMHPQESRTRSLQLRRRKRPRLVVWRLHCEAVGCRSRRAQAHLEAQGHCPVALVERRRLPARYDQPRQEAARVGCWASMTALRPRVSPV